MCECVHTLTHAQKTGAGRGVGEWGGQLVLSAASRRVFKMCTQYVEYYQSAHICVPVSACVRSARLAHTRGRHDDDDEQTMPAAQQRSVLRLVRAEHTCTSAAAHTHTHTYVHNAQRCRSIAPQRGNLSVVAIESSQKARKQQLVVFPRRCTRHTNAPQEYRNNNSRVCVISLRTVGACTFLFG